MPEVFLTCEPVGKTLLIRLLTETVSQREADIIAAEFFDHPENAAYANVVVDLSDVYMLTSMGLGTLIRMNTHCKNLGGKLALFGLSTELQGLLKAASLHKLLNVCDSKEKALKAVG